MKREKSIRSPRLLLLLFPLLFENRGRELLNFPPPKERRAGARNVEGLAPNFLGVFELDLYILFFGSLPKLLACPPYAEDENDA